MLGVVHHSSLVLLVDQVRSLLILSLDASLGHFSRDLYDKVVGDCRRGSGELVDWEVKAEEERLDQPLLHDDLIEVSQHVVDTCQVRHQQFEPKRLGNVDDWNMDLVWPAQVRTFVPFVAAPQRTQN
jgi:hypothetical protein